MAPRRRLPTLKDGPELDLISDVLRPEVRIVSGKGHYESIVRATMNATRSIWIGTATLKELMVEDDRAHPGRRRGRDTYRSFVEVLGEAAARGVEVRILHASFPSRAFRDRFDELPQDQARLIHMRSCPRVHLKCVIVDASLLYLGSANWTGAGMGAKGSGRRNFEMGIVTRDDALIDHTQEIFDHLYRGGECDRCKLSDECEMPISAMEDSAPAAVFG